MLLAGLLLSTGGACGMTQRAGGEAARLPVGDEKKLAASLDAFFAEVLRGLGAPRPASPPSGGSDSCGPDDEVRFDDKGDSSPYNIASFSSIEKMPPDDLAPAIERLRAHAQQAGWVITRFRPLADGRQNTELAGHDPKTGNGLSAEALHDKQRIVISVGSPCVRAPWDQR